MEISVIMSEYQTNKEILEQSIVSILTQTFVNFELIIVDDGGSESLKNILKTINDKRIVVIRNNENIGLAKSLNKAIQVAKGDYLIRMDTDDVAHKDRFQKQLDFIKKNKHYSVVGTSINFLTEKNQLIPLIYEGEIDKNQLMRRIAPVHPSVIMNKKDIIEIGLYKTHNVSRCEDFVLWSELLIANKRIYIMEDILLNYRLSFKDYEKRKLSTRKDEILNRFKYYKRLDANLLQYLSIIKSVVSGIIPNKIMANYHRNKAIPD